MFNRKKASKDSSPQARSRYVDHSLKFMDWVNRLGLERTFLGRAVLFLEERFNIKRVGILFLFCVTLSGLLAYEIDFSVDLGIGDVATVDIKSPITFEIIDEVATEAKRVEAEDSIPPIFDYDSEAYDNVVRGVYESFRAMRTQVKQVKWSRSEAQREEQIKEFMVQKPEFEKLLGREVSERIFEWLIESQFSARIENVLIRIIESWSENKIVESLEPAIPMSQEQLMIRVMARVGIPAEEYQWEKSKLWVSSDETLFNRQLTTIYGFDKLSPQNKEFILKLAHAIKIPNLSFNKQETADRRKKSRDGVLPVVISVKKNQTIVSQGAVVRPIHATLLNEIEKLKSTKRKDFVSLLVAVMFTVLILVFFSYLRRFTMQKIVVTNKDISVMGVVTLIVAMLVKMFLFVVDATFAVRLGTSIAPEVFLFAAPVAAGPMLVGLLISSGEIVWLFTVFLALAMSFVVELDFSFMVVSIVGGIAAARGVFGCKKRNDIYFAGLRTGLVNAAMIGLILLAQSGGEDTSWTNTFLAMGSGFLAGIFSSLIAMMLVPLLESLFQITTDVRLLELSNLNHPLLRDMIVKSPGTYHHSLIVGSMVEAAAEKIGANPLLGKVMSYYHDIGKMEYSDYFIENQKPGKNPHDHLSPNMSKTILIAHVKDGVELGMKHKLGKPIIDGILQHHGTTLISFFYNKALEIQNENVDMVAEADFRYPGPKPQFKEAALCMLADSIEAAARSLDEPTPTRLQNIVKNIIQRKFMDGQLDECNLTLRDLTIIEQAFIHILLGIYHQRIDYPKKAGGGAAESPTLGLPKPKKKTGSPA